MDLTLLALCAVVVWMDLRRGIIPDWANAGISVLGLLDAALSGWNEVYGRGMDAVLMAALLSLIRHGYRRLRGRTGLGLGDVKFLTAATLLIGLLGVQIAILAACLSSLAMLAIARCVGKTVTASSKIRFGPHLVFGLLIAVYVFPAKRLETEDTYFLRRSAPQSKLFGPLTLGPTFGGVDERVR